MNDPLQELSNMISKSDSPKMDNSHVLDTAEAQRLITLAAYDRSNLKEQAEAWEAVYLKLSEIGALDASTGDTGLEHVIAAIELLHTQRDKLMELGQAMTDCIKGNCP